MEYSVQIFLDNDAIKFNLHRLVSKQKVGSFEKAGKLWIRGKGSKFTQVE